MEKDIELSLKNQEEKERVDRVLEILLEADLIYLGKLLEEENNCKRKSLTKGDKGL